MPVTFEALEVGRTYDRPTLARLWGYQAHQALGRGVFTPSRSNKIVLFITKEKQSHLTQYEDILDADMLAIEGERTHQSDRRIIRASESDDEIHFFYRAKHHQDFTYYGQITLSRFEEHADRPSRFWFALDPFNAIAQSTIETERETYGDTSGFPGDEEGRKRLVQSVRYERSPKNRAAALRFHGTVCKACGFDFDKVYGEKHARHFIQIHHVSSVTGGVRKINPKTDLMPLCSNCHSMAHRKTGEILSLRQLQKLLTEHC